MKRWEQILSELEKKMDARDRVYELLDRLNAQGKPIPSEYIAAWNQHQTDKRPWREIPRLKKKLIKTAKLMARNETLSPDEKKAMAMRHLKRVF